MRNFSEYVVYVDESGDHSLRSINPNYPVFVLAFCIFKKSDYVAEAVPQLQRMKFKYFGHDMVVFHEREIRKQDGPFALLADKATRNEFHSELGALVEEIPFTVIAVVIKKAELNTRYVAPENPYDIGVKYGLERLYAYLSGKGAAEGRTHVVFEARGTKEDAQLELAFRRVCDGNNYNGQIFPFEVVIASKKANSGGLQLADLVARPIGRHVLNPAQANRAYDVLREKFCEAVPGHYKGVGLKIFP